MALLHPSCNETEEWLTTGEGTFNLPPLEFAARPTVMNWRGVRFGDVAKELYYENDNWHLLRDSRSIGVNLCAKTGEPPQIDAEDLVLMYKHSQVPATWQNMTAVSAQSFVCSCMSLGPEKRVIGEGFSNSVPIEHAYYSNFHMPDADDSNLYDPKASKSSDPESKQSIHHTIDDQYAPLTVAVSYTHKVKQSQHLLKANQFQIDQLEQILSAIRENPPTYTRFVRLWTDVAHSRKMGTIKPKDRPKWIFHGLLPYTVFPVAWLRSGDEADKASMWCSCEQILADGGLGCLFPLLPGVEPSTPPLAKETYCGAESMKSTRVVKTVGDGLSINRNLTKLAAAIHSGVLENTVTYHIADAQELLRLAYYMTRKQNVSMVHGVNCEECLHATFRESVGFATALHACCDLFDENADKDMQLRLNKTQMSYPYLLYSTVINGALSPRCGANAPRRYHLRKCVRHYDIAYNTL